MPDARLAELARVHAEFGEGCAGPKLELLEALGTTNLRSRAEVLRLHEILCFLRACPDDARVLATAERVLASFASRPDLKHFRARLVNSGIAGTDIDYPFFFPTACWLVDRLPRQLRVLWREFNSAEQLERLLPLLTTPAEMPLVDEFEYTPSEWVARLKSSDESDAEFLVKAFRNLDMSQPAQEKLWDAMGTWMRLESGPETPSRTRAKHPLRTIHWQAEALDRKRPDLSRLDELKPRSVRAVSRREGQALIDLAQEAMVTRERDLDVFAYGDPDDVRLVDCGRGLQFAAIGALPERRLLLESVYGFLTLKNGVPTGYVLSSALFGSSEIAYNVFDTFRGGEAARTYGHVLAMLRHLFGSDTFVVFPYQLGWHNEEGLKSGAWWFYQKLGFRAKHAETLRLMDGELRRMKADPTQRSSIATLRKLSEQPVYFHAGRERDDVIGRISLGDIGRQVAAHLGKRFGAERRKATRQCGREAAKLLGFGPQSSWLPGERWWFDAWAPLALALPGIETWSATERRALSAVMRTKGSRRESDYVRLLNRHAKLRAALLALATPE